ncbi:hypothetical protein DFH08DRAFT_821684 [Mycena albidolilacea]|uniref:HD domain-containing protein n=1 Tax=Mycena albidolilacea TaxID=1033008 RepID=A0AAD6Z995_9AGAR|nr:hypothetical protein DFH08DRAFT_821684 [Mycena albidolilacea]
MSSALRTHNKAQARHSTKVTCFMLNFSTFKEFDIHYIGFEELSLRLYHTTLLHDLGRLNSTDSEVLNPPAHAMTFELHGGCMAYEQLHITAPDFDADQVSDIVQSIVLHTLQWSSGDSSATQVFMSVSALFNIEGHNGTGIVGLDFNRLWHPKTMEEIEKAYPWGDFYHQALAAVDREFAQKPNCLVSHFPGGLDWFTNEFRVGPIVLRHLNQLEGLDRGLRRAQ